MENNNIGKKSTVPSFQRLFAMIMKEFSLLLFLNLKLKFLKCKKKKNIKKQKEWKKKIYYKFSIFL